MTEDRPSTGLQPGNALRTSRFARLGARCHDRRRVVLAAWIAVLVFGGALSGAVGNAFRDDFNLPDVESKDGFDILDESFGGQGTGQSGTIVFRAEQGVEDPAVRSAMEAVFDRVAAIEEVERVQSPYAEGGERQIASEGPHAGRSPSPPSSSPRTWSSNGRPRSARRSGRARRTSRASWSRPAGSSSPGSTSRRPRSWAWPSPW